MKSKKVTLKNKVVFITGGTGSIGSEVVRQVIKKNPKEVRIFSRGEEKHCNLRLELKKINTKGVKVDHIIGDIRDLRRLDECMPGVDFVFHAAGLKHITYCEENPTEAIETNINGTRNILEVARKWNVKRLVAVSTDKAINPISMMGKTKLLMEHLVLNNNQLTGMKCGIVRFGNVLWSRGSVLPIWLEQLSKGENLTVTDPDMKRYFTTITNAASCLINALITMEGGDIFVLNMKQKKIIDLAKEFALEYGNGKRVGIDITGIRPGEKIDEELLTKEEKARSKAGKKMTVILPDYVGKTKYYRLNFR